MIKDMRIAGKLRMVAGLAMVGVVFVGLVGGVTAIRLNRLAHDLATQAIEPLSELATVNELMQANMTELLGAANHNPALEAAKYHDHPYTKHTDAIKKNAERISQAWQNYLASGVIDADLVRQYEEKRTRFLQDGVAKGVQLADEQKFGELAVHVTTTALPLFNQAKAVAERLNQLHNERADALEAEAATLKAFSLWAIAGSITVGVVLILGVMMVIARSITNPLSGVVTSLTQLADGNASTDIVGQDRKDEIGDVARAAAILRRHEIERRRLEEAAEGERRAKEERAQTVSRLAKEFDGKVVEVIGVVTSAVSQLQSSAQGMSTVSEQTMGLASAVAAASEETAANVQTVAAASEELSASSREIAAQVTQASSIAQSAAAEAASTDELVRGLADAARKIGDVVNLINDIASQTNLLALNATIEAARAGDAGKGFAVVANEVKNLANQTAKATDEISAQIAGVQQQTGDAVNAIRSIAGTIERMNEISGAIAAAVEEQGAATQEIARNIAEAHSGSVEVARHIGGVTDGAQRSTEAAASLLGVSQDLNHQTDSLRTVVDEFLRGVRS